MFKEAFLRSKFYWISVSLISLLSYGFTLTNYSIGVDDEAFDLYFNQGALLSQGRWGAQLTKILFDSYTFLPFWRDFIAVLLIVSGVTLWVALIKKASNNYFNELSLTIFACVAISCPLIVENFIFMMTTIEMGLVLCMTGLSLNLFFDYINGENKFRNAMFAVLLLTYGLAFSELAVVYFLLGSLIVCFIYTSLSEYKENYTFKQLFLILIKTIILIMITLILNSLIKNFLQKLLSIQDSGYVGNLIAYDFSSLSGFFHSFFNFISLLIQTLPHDNQLGMTIALISSALLFIYAVFLCVSLKKMHCLIFAVGIILTVFSLYFLTGNVHLTKRIFITNSVFVGFVMATIYMALQNVKIWKINLRVIVTIAIVLLLFYQTKYMNQVFFVDHLRYQADSFKARVIADDINEMSNKQKGVIFIGQPTNYNLPLGDTVGYSIFQWDRFTGIQSQLQNDHRIFNFLKMHGYDFAKAGGYNENKVVSQADNMPVYPKQGYVKEFNDYIIVKLGAFPYKSLNLNPDQFNKKFVDKTNEAQYSTDNFTQENNTLNIRGWAFIKNNLSKNIHVALISKQKQYILDTQSVIRNDVTLTLNDNENHDNSGYEVAGFSTSMLSSGKYKVALIFDENNIVYIDSQVVIN